MLVGRPALASALALGLWGCVDKATTPNDGGDTSSPDTGDNSDSGGTGDTGTAEDADGDGWGAAEDCDDSDPTVHPGAVERCNEQDDDCDEEVDEGGAVRVEGDEAAYEDLQSAIDAAPSGGTVHLCPGDFEGNLHIDDTVMLSATQTGAAAIIGDGSGPAVTITGTGVTLLGVQISGGAATSTTSNCGGGVVVDGGNASVLDSKITDNTATLGGGVCVVDGTLDLSGTAVRSNTASAYGGGAFVTAGELYGNDDTELSDNEAELGGGVAVYLAGVLDGGVINSNSADYGGGLAAFAATGDDAAGLIATGLSLAANDAGYGGGVYVERLDATLSGLTLQRNQADVGGGLRMYDDAGGGHVTTLSSTTVDDNTAVVGGGLSVYRASLVLTEVLFTDNLAEGTGTGEGMGGAAAVVGTSGGPAAATLSACTFTGNHAESAGGGLVLYLADGVLWDNAFDANTAADSGGAMAVYSASDGSTTVSSSTDTWTDNSAQRGGAVLMSGGQLLVEGGSFTGNSADAVAGALALSDTVVGGLAQLSQVVMHSNTCGTATTDGGGAVAVGRDYTLELDGADMGEDSADNSPDDVWLEGSNLHYTALGADTSTTCTGNGICN